MPRYRFNWANISPDLLDALAPGAADPCAELRASHGARPKEAFVKERWPELREHWLSVDATARAEVVAELVASGIGKAAPADDCESQLAYLRELRNAKTLRTVVLAAFHRLGEATAATVSRHDRSDDLDLVARPWITEEVPVGMDTDDLGEGVLDLLQHDLRMDDEWVARDRFTLQWWGGPVPLEVTAEPPRVILGDPTVKVVCSVTVAADVSADEAMVLGLLASVNRLSSFGALVWIPEERAIRAFTTHYAHAENRGVTGLLPFVALLVYTQALGKVSAGFAGGLGGTEATRPHPRSGPRSDFDEMVTFTDRAVIPEGAGDNRWTGEELESVAVEIASAGFAATGDGTGLTAEFPFSSSRPSAMQAALGTTSPGSTALFQQRLDMPHPGYGTGLFNLIRLPLHLEDGEPQRLANRLNRAELESTTGTPSWGAWCATNEHEVGRVAFLPNVLWRPGLAGTMANYAYTVTQWAAELTLPIDVVRDVRAGRR